MTLDEAIKRLEIEKKRTCLGCMHPQSYRYCEEVCQIQEAFEIVLKEVKKK